MHFSRKSLIELMFSLNKGLTDGLVIKPEDTGVTPNLVNKRLQEDAFGIMLHFHSSKCRTHPCRTLDRPMGRW